MNLIKPPKLKKGDKVAAISLSWGGASVYPHRYEAGKKQFQDAFGVEVVETPNARTPAQILADDPKMRADDLMWAFKNPEIKAIISVIGGDDSIRLLPYIDYDMIRNNPKIFMGYSDATVTHFMCLHAGLSSIYGPTFMAGFGENGGLFDYMSSSVDRTLFSSAPIGQVMPNLESWTDDNSLLWSDPENQKIKRPMKDCVGWKTLQGEEKTQGHIIGGCVEVLEMLKGTKIWPTNDIWKDAVLFLETSEEAPSVDFFVRCIRNYAASGIIENLSAILLGRPANVSENLLNQYDDALIHVVNKEYGYKNIPILSQMDFGHTDPMFLIPYGANAEIDPKQTALKITSNAVS